MKTLVVSDLESSNLNSRRMCFSHLTPETERCLDQLADLIAKRIEEEQMPKKGVTKREVQKMRIEWNSSAPLPIRNRRAMLYMSSGFHAGDQYMDAEFYKAHPECLVIEPPGRPRWYVHPSRLPRVARGEAIALLINLAGDQLLKNLTPKTEEKSKRSA